MQPVLRSARCLAVSVFVALFLGGCVSNKYQAASAVGATPLRMDISLGGEPMTTHLDAIIVYQGPGSWKKAAYWDEWLVTFSNPSDTEIVLTATRLLDFSGAEVPAGADPWQLEKASLAQRDRYTRAGVSFALNTLGYAALTYGTVGVGAMTGAYLTSSWGGVTAGATVGLIAVPVTAILIYADNQKHKHAIEGEFNRRRLTLPLSLPARESRSGSLFFPMTVGPQSLRLEWMRGTQRGLITLPLPMLTGMHRKAPGKEATR